MHQGRGDDPVQVRCFSPIGHGPGKTQNQREGVKNITVRFLSVRLKKKWFEAEQVVNAIKKDKKRRTGHLPAVLFSSNNKLEVVQDVKPEEVKKALGELTDFLNKNDKL